MRVKRPRTSGFLAETALETPPIVFDCRDIYLVAQRVIKPQIRSPPQAESMRPRRSARHVGFVIDTKTNFLQQRTGSIAQRALQRIRMQTSSASRTLKCSSGTSSWSRSEIRGFGGRKNNVLIVEAGEVDWHVTCNAANELARVRITDFCLGGVAWSDGYMRFKFEAQLTDVALACSIRHKIGGARQRAEEDEWEHMIQTVPVDGWSDIHDKATRLSPRKRSPRNSCKRQYNFTIRT